MKQTVSLFMTVLLLISLCACSGENVIATVSPNGEAAPAATENIRMTEAASAPEIHFSFDDLQYTDFLFCSGAGAWGTTLYIEADGSFSGVYRDSEMGDTGEGYPQGTVYHCAFFGQFGAPVKVNECTYSLPIQVLRYEHAPDTQEIRDQQRYCYTTALGIEGTQSLLIYLPGASVEALPLEYRQWVGLHGDDTAQLPFWGLYNEAQQCGFSSTDRIQSVRELVVTAEEVEASINALRKEHSTQSDMNIAAQQRYVVWDDALNQLWALLKQVLDESEMQALTNDQLVWIREKEQIASDAAAEFQGGSLSPMVYSDTAADLTKERVYYLLGYLP